MILYSLLPFYKKERIKFNSEKEQNKIGYKRVLSDLKDKEKIALEECADKKNKSAAA